MPRVQLRELSNRSIWSIVLILLIVFAATGNAQIPDKFTNLKVLPAHITKPELVGKMKELCFGLGVRCEFCHEGDPEKGFSSFDFAADTKEHKRTARVMLKMTEAINSEHLSKLENAESESQKVTCFTCHHGYMKPKSLNIELAETIESKGVDSAILLYGKLRDEFYGQAVYDFGESSIVKLASDLAQSGNSADAIVLLNVNLEYYPKSVFTYQTLALAQLSAGQAPEAINSIKKALEIEPDNQQLKAFLQKLSNSGEKN